MSWRLILGADHLQDHVQHWMCSTIIATFVWNMPKRSLMWCHACTTVTYLSYTAMIILVSCGTHCQCSAEIVIDRYPGLGEPKVKWKQTQWHVRDNVSNIFLPKTSKEGQFSEISIPSFAVLDYRGLYLSWVMKSTWLRYPFTVVMQSIFSSDVIVVRWWQSVCQSLSHSWYQVSVGYPTFSM